MIKKTGLLILFWLAGLNPLWAHHVAGHGGTGNSSFNPYSSQSRPPETFLDFSFGFDRLDGGLGHIFTYQLSGEYSVHRRVSFGARIPLLTIREKFLSETTHLGDLGVSAKILAREWPLEKIFLSVGSEVSFPTGNREEGTGAGAVLFAPYATLSKGFKNFSILATTGFTLAASEESRPSVDYATALMIPVVKRRLPIDFSLSLQGSTVIASETFASGSSKIYLKPALSFHLRPKIIATLGAKVSVIDTLSVKSDIALSRLSTAPLSDVRAGFLFDIHYSF